MTKTSDASEHGQETLRMLKHHVRTPMATIQGMAQLLHDEPDMEHEERAEFVAIIQRESARLAAMTEDVLVLAHTWKQSKATDRETCSLERVFEKLIRFGVPSRSNYSTTIRVTPPTHVVVLHIDESTATYLILKMIDFALSYTCEEGTLEVSVEPMEDAQATEKKGLRIRITSQQMRPSPPSSETLHHHFEEPYRHSGGSRHIPEIGLGPYLIREIADRLGWCLGARVSEDGGLYLWLDIPQ